MQPIERFLLYLLFTKFEQKDVSYVYAYGGMDNGHESADDMESILGDG